MPNIMSLGGGGGGGGWVNDSTVGVIIGIGLGQA